MTGVVPALGAAVGFAIFQVVNARALATIDVYRGTRVLLGMATLILGTITILTDGISLWVDAPPRALFMSAAAGMVHFFLGWTLLGTAQQRIGAARAGALIGTVPLFGALVAWIVLGETVGPLQIAGLIVVVNGVVFIATANRRGPAELQLLAGVAAALGTALCWSVSPVLIRQGLEGIPSPRAAASVGLLMSALLYAVLFAVARRRRESLAMAPNTRVLLGTGGFLVAFSLWMQWTAFDRAPVATVLVLLQLTPALVPILARIGTSVTVGRLTVARLYFGILAIIIGSLPVILIDG